VAHIPIEDYKDKYHGKTIFLLGNGPSLNVLPIRALRDYYTLTVNEFIPYGIREFSFTPTFWASSYGGAYDRSHQEIVKCGLDKQKIRLVLPEDYFSVIREGWEPIVSPVRDQPVSDPAPIREVVQKFQDTGLSVVVVPVHLLAPRFFGVGVITHLAIPFCCYLGFKRIVVVGMDLGGWNAFYSVKCDKRLRRNRLEETRTCWDGKDRPNFEAVKNLNQAIFSGQIPEYTRLIPSDVKFYHTTPRPKEMSSTDRLKATLGLSKGAKTGFVDLTGDGFYIHELEEFVKYLSLDDAMTTAEKREAYSI